jgi:hypothetical protein
MQCTKLKATKLLGHVQPARDVDPDTSWRTTTTGTLVDIVALLAISKNKQF